MPSAPRIVVLVGAGVVGRGWIRVFAAHDVEVRTTVTRTSSAGRSSGWTRIWRLTWPRASSPPMSGLRFSDACAVKLNSPPR